MYYKSTTNRTKTKNDEQLQVFDIESMLDKKLREHTMLCFNKDDYMYLKHNWIEYTNVTTLQLFEYFYDEYGEKTEKM